MSESGAGSAISPYASGPGEGVATWFLGTLMTLKATGTTTRDAFGLIEQDLPAEFATPMHRHHREDEAFYILEGHISFTCGERVLDAPAGTFVFLPRDTPHGFRVVGGLPARLLQINTPAGLEQMFVDAGEAARDRTQPPAMPPQMEKLLPALTHYDCEIVGPPPGTE